MSHLCLIFPHYPTLEQERAMKTQQLIISIIYQNDQKQILFSSIGVLGEFDKRNIWDKRDLCLLWILPKILLDLGSITIRDKFVSNKHDQYFQKMTIHVKNTQMNFSQSDIQLGMSEKYWYVVSMSLSWYTDGVWKFKKWLRLKILVHKTCGNLVCDWYVTKKAV